MNTPNSITLARLLLVPVFFLIASMKIPYADYIAAAVFVVGAATDGIDGYIARKNKQVTRLGRFLDPLVDKIMVAAALILLVEMGRLPGWIALIIIGRELSITGLRAFASVEGIVISASVLGKIKTVTQVVAVVAILIKDYPFNMINLPVGSIAISLAIFFTVWSGLDYFIKAWDMLKNCSS